MTEQNKTASRDEIQRLTCYLPFHTCYQFGTTQDAINKKNCEKLTGCVVYFDIIGFTNIALSYLSKNKDIADLSSTLSDFYSVMTEAVRGSNGSIYQFAGDSILISFSKGSNETPEQNFSRALSTMLAILDLCDNYNQVNEKQNGFSLKAKVGIAYGEYYQFLLGNETLFITPVLVGNAQFAAVSCENACKKQEIVINQRTYNLACNMGYDDCFTREEDLYHLTTVTQKMKNPPDQSDYIGLDDFYDNPDYYQSLSHCINPLILQQIRSGFTGFSGEYKDVTCMMIGFSGDFSIQSSPYSETEQANAESVRSKINLIYTLLHEFSRRYGAYCTKPDISDKGLVFPILFGTPNVIEYKEQNALLLADDLRRETEALNFIQSIRIGIATGMVYSGEFGGYLRKDYTSIGNPINFASRLMTALSFEEPFSILIDKQTAAMTKKQTELELVIGITCKGYDGPQTACKVAGLKQQKKTATQSRTVFGRQEELETLNEAFSQTKSGKSCSLLVSADEGIGKTFLVNTFLDTISHNEEDTVILRGKMFQYESNTAFYIWESIFSTILTAQERESLSKSTFSNSDDFIHIRNAMKRYANGKKMIIFLDNIQWCDEASFTLVQNLIEHPVDFPLFFICTSRATEDIITTFAMNVVPVLNLQPLSVKDAYFYTESALHFKEGDPELILRIITASGGNPLFIDNIVHSLINSGKINEDYDGFRSLAPGLTNSTEIEIPTSMQNVILSRLSTLSYREQILLKTASAIGFKFDTNTLKSILPEKIDDDELIALLSDIQLHNLLDQELEENTWGFKTSFIHQIIYDTILETTKKELNTTILSVLEETHKDNLDQIAEKLLYHAIEAKDYGKIHTYALISARKAEEQFAFSDAHALYKTAVDAVKMGVSDKKDDSLIILESKIKQTKRSLESFEKSAGLTKNRRIPAFLSNFLNKMSH